MEKFCLSERRSPREHCVPQAARVTLKGGRTKDTIQHKPQNTEEAYKSDDHLPKPQLRIRSSN